MRLFTMASCLVLSISGSSLAGCGQDPDVIRAEMSEVAALQSVALADLAGAWRGGLEVGPTVLRLELRLTVSPDGLSGELVSIDQGNVVIALDSVLLDGAQFSFVDSGNGATYEGVVGEDGRIVGLFTQRGRSFALTFERGAVDTAVARVADGEADTAVIVTNLATGETLTLAGSLRQPDAARAGVVILSGSGSQDRNGAIAGQSIYAAWADVLADIGVASLRLDDRGIGGSDRVIPQSPVDLSVDADAALAHLRAETGLSCVGYVGHSEGAWIALLAAQNAAPDFIISMAGQHEAMEPMLYRQSEAIIRASGGGDAAVEGNRVLQEAMFTVLRAAEPADDIAGQLEDALLSVGAPQALAQSQAAIWGQSYAAASFQLDPAEAAGAYEGPVLGLFGATDTQVLAEPTSAILVNSRGPLPTRIVTIDGVDHLFQDNASGAPSAYGSAGHALSPTAAQVMVMEITTLIERSCPAN